MSFPGQATRSEPRRQRAGAAHLGEVATARHHVKPELLHEGPNHLLVSPPCEQETRETTSAHSLRPLSDLRAALRPVSVSPSPHVLIRDERAPAEPAPLGPGDAGHHAARRGRAEQRRHCDRDRRTTAPRDPSGQAGARWPPSPGHLWRRR